MSFAARAEPDEAAELFRVLGHPLRMAILRVLGEGERAVGDIAGATGIVMSTLSQQLAILRKAELVLTRREAKQVFYSINDAAVARVRAALDALCPGAAAPAQGMAALTGPGSGRIGAAMFARVHPRP
ncbi:MAG: metalloregulator ArsR/SmtB family transcription factor [Alphaproteobacteria bacterium]|nr:metalloregulator ArsR/SmtB family transcription factor [Alphaproteobacteria bacterium]